MPHRNPILCVDDAPVNLGLIRQVLQDDYRLAFATSGQEALKAAAKHRPSLILLDVEMPDMSGYDVARQIKRDAATAHTPIIFVTALNSVIDEQAGFDAGGVDYITKPISPPILLARVRTHLSLVRASALEASYLDAIHMLGSAGHYNDQDTGVHIWRMGGVQRTARTGGGVGSRQCLAAGARGDHARHRQDWHPRCHSQETRSARCRGMGDHADALPDWPRDPLQERGTAVSARQ